MRRVAALILVLLLPGVPALAGPGGSVPPPTPVPPAGSPSPYPTALDTPPPSAEDPRVPARAVALGDLDTGRVLFEKNADERRPIASLTKIMTALLVIERTTPGEPVVVTPNAAGQVGAELGLEVGERLPVRELLLALLLQSANDAAVALAEHVGGSVEAFVDEMNVRARELGLRDTEFRSPSGLDDSGYSTASDLLALAGEAFRNPTFAAVVGTKFQRIPAPNGEKRQIQNRNALLWLYPGAIGGKTGYTAAAGFCLVASAEREGLRLVTAVLGAPAQAFDDGAEILNHGFAAWERRTVVGLGQSFEPVEVEGRSVFVEADAALSLLLPRGTEVALDLEPDPAATLPVSVGDQLGEVVAVSGDREVGRVPVVASESVVAQPSPGPGPPEGDPRWWEELWDAFSGLYGVIERAIAD
jgi:D-alanyl-D-alanine carboxypeptidase (penicillin-binding protein 5/6)